MLSGLFGCFLAINVHRYKKVWQTDKQWTDGKQDWHLYDEWNNTINVDRRSIQESILNDQKYVDDHVFMDTFGLGMISWFRCGSTLPQ